MTQQITIRVTKNYGTTVVYPVCDTAKKLAELIGTKTFTNAALHKLVDLGYEMTVEQQTFSYNAPYNDQFLGAQPARAGQDY